MATTMLKFFQVDAFASQAFRGNPAAVMPLATWLPDETLQAIAAENNLSETAFFVPRASADRFALRWFTPVAEVPLCGHATLASAWVVFHRVAPGLAEVTFETLSGDLKVSRGSSPQGRETLTLNFPVLRLSPLPVSDAVAEALGQRPLATFDGRDLLAVLPDAATVRALAPDLARLAALHPHAVCVTAPGTGEDADVDFVSRFFAPRYGIDEDPVTGSAHSHLGPYWAERLGKTTLRARQVSRRGGELTVALRGDRVDIGGEAVLMIEGSFFLP